MIDPTAKIYPGVQIGRGATIGEFALIGVPARGEQPGSVATIIGDDCVIRSHSVLYSGNVIGHRFQTGHHAMIREANEIGDDVSIGSLTVVEHHIRIGNGARIHSRAFIAEYSTIAEQAWLGPGVNLLNARFPASPTTKRHLVGATIGAAARLGGSVTVLSGVTIGANALIGAGALVTRDIAPSKLAFGHPAAEIRDIQELRYDDDNEPPYR